MKIGKIEIHNPVFLAPMEDVSDTPFRLICKRLGADVLVTEFTSSEALIRNVKTAFHKISIRDEERPIGVQIFGSNEETMANAARIAESIRPDFIDINCGCWVRNLVARGEGAGLLKNIPKLERIIKKVVATVTVPVTVKTRLGWDHDNIVILDVAKIVEAQGAKALTVHCRTRSQGYGGNADWSWLEKIRKTISIPLIANGDIKTPEHAKILFEMGCDGIMIGRAAISNPWIFQQTKHFLSTGQHLSEATMQERIDLCIEHLRLSVQFKGKRTGVADFRKHYAGYLSGFPFIARLRAGLIALNDSDEIIRQLTNFKQSLA
ncbi:MAG TPA: tRNA dihydrouridine synthase DusB [Candidatus Omnitrophota bacterium]|nr:tRNA dihydrouridine synthase DusB [Candidatus Omnitrophota bacterium]